MDNEMISPELLEILVCPVCKAGIALVEYQPGAFGLKCSACENIYPIRDGIPVMLPEEAVKVGRGRPD